MDKLVGVKAMDGSSIFKVVKDFPTLWQEAFPLSSWGKCNWINLFCYLPYSEHSIE